MYLGTLVQDGLAHMRGVIWRAAPAKFKRGMCEMKNFRLQCVLGHWFRTGWPTCVVQHGELFRKSSKQMCEMKILGSEVLWCIFGTLVQGWHTCVVSSVSELFRQSSKQGCVRRKCSDLKFVVCLGRLVQDGLAHMRGVTWGAAPAKFKTDV